MERVVPFEQPLHPVDLVSRAPATRRARNVGVKPRLVREHRDERDARAASRARQLDQSAHKRLDGGAASGAVPVERVRRVAVDGDVL